MKAESPIPIVLTIAGSDSSGGAGVQADIKTFSALKVYGASVITAVTAQNTRQVNQVLTMPERLVQGQIEAVLDDLNVAAIKIGMLASSSIIRAVSATLAGYTGCIVLDPVMVAKSGDQLLAPDAIDALRDLLLPRADLLTPNYPEAAVLLDTLSANHPEEALAQGGSLQALGAKAVLMKGGHGNEPLCTDWLLLPQEDPVKLESMRVQTINTHGTGCTYAAAIAAYLARKNSLLESVKRSHRYLAGAIRAADRLQVGRGQGPVHHFYQVWND